jgi:hypothetical protein
VEIDPLLIKALKQYLLPTFSAIILLLLGLGASLIAISYEVGSFTRMGPGFIPLALAISLALLAGVILLRERSVSELLAPVEWRPFLAVIAGILAWVILVETAGFFIASACQILLCSLALPNQKWRSILIFTLALTLIGYLIFVLQLGVPLNAFG